jgi:nicotinamidase-related amidase
MRDWMKIVPAEDLGNYGRGGFFAGMRPGRRAALIVVDATMGFCGAEGLTLAEAIAQYPTACGPSSWIAMPRIAELVGVFRRLDLPIVYSLADLNDAKWTGNATKSENSLRRDGFNDFPPSIAPRERDWVMSKEKASAFFHTPLTIYLTRQNVDTLFFCGVSTSGCVRATVVDGFSNGYKTFVVDECCFDRSEFAHAANLFDMQAKYAAVVSLAEARELLEPAARAAAE